MIQLALMLLGAYVIGWASGWAHRVNSEEDD